MSRLIQIGLSIPALQYGIVPAIVDLSDSHVFNIDWTAHSRFHMVWLLSLSTLIGLWVLWATWLSQRRYNQNHLKLVSIQGTFVLSAFFLSTITRNLYGGSLSDVEHSVLVFGFEGNLVSFTIAMMIQIFTMVAIWRGSSASLSDRPFFL